MHSANNYNS